MRERRETVQEPGVARPDALLVTDLDHPRQQGYERSPKAAVGDDLETLGQFIQLP